MGGKCATGAPIRAAPKCENRVRASRGTGLESHHQARRTAASGTERCGASSRPTAKLGRSHLRRSAVAAASATRDPFREGWSLDYSYTSQRNRHGSLRLILADNDGKSRCPSSHMADPLLRVDVTSDWPRLRARRSLHSITDVAPSYHQSSDARPSVGLDCHRPVSC